MYSYVIHFLHPDFLVLLRIAKFSHTHFQRFSNANRGQDKKNLGVNNSADMKLALNISKTWNLCMHENDLEENLGSN